MPSKSHTSSPNLEAVFRRDPPNTKFGFQEVVRSTGSVWREATYRPDMETTRLLSTALSPRTTSSAQTEQEGISRSHCPPPSAWTIPMFHAFAIFQTYVVGLA